MNLVIDIGNTVAKLAVFDAGELVEVCHDSNQNLTQLSLLAERYPLEKSIVSSVVGFSEKLHEQLDSLKTAWLCLDSSTPVPVTNRYETPETLGSDRLAAVVAAHSLYPENEVLVIDAGTCITYEFVDSNGCYYGGNISPGIQMRLNSLHAYTDRLPLVHQTGPCPLLGTSTETAIRAGVMQGVAWEMEGYISRLREAYPRLLVCLTGGDEVALHEKYSPIVCKDKFLVLRGLNRILEYNNDNIQ